MEPDPTSQSLAEYLGIKDPRAPEAPVFPSPGKMTAKAFCEAVLNSEEFRTYILNGLVYRDLHPTILKRIMDQGWGKPTEHIEHTGKDGEPIETITVVRRVIVPPSEDEHETTPRRVSVARDDDPSGKVH